MKKIMLVFSIAFALFASFAQAKEHKFEITPVIGGVEPEGNLDLEDHMFYGLGLGIDIGKDYWFNKVEFALEYSPDVKIYNTNGETRNILRGTAHLVKDLKMTNYFKFYGLLGLGAEYIPDGLRGNGRAPYFSYGGGMRYWLTENLGLKAELRHGIKVRVKSHKYDDFNRVRNSLFYSLGLVYGFGGDEEEQSQAEEVLLKPAIETTEFIEEVEPKDDDNDGVINDVDECPNTPLGTPVDEVGCAKAITAHVNFEYKKFNILPQYDGEIQKVADFMKKFPDFIVSLEGYTDNIGGEKYNIKLSDKRSASFAKALIEKGISKDRIKTVGYGEANPIASNETDEGRAQNRRVEAVFSRKEGK